MDFKASYYYFQSDLVKDIMGDGAAFFQGEVNYAVTHDFVVFADAGYLSNRGQSLNFDQRTRLEAVPFSLGIKYNYPLGCGSVYVGGGVRGFAVHIENKSEFVDPFIKGISAGGVVNAGFNLCYKCIILNPFFEYSFIKLPFHRSAEDIARNIYRHDLNLNGFALGAGVGYVY